MLGEVGALGDSNGGGFFVPDAPIGATVALAGEGAELAAATERHALAACSSSRLWARSSSPRRKSFAIMAPNPP